MARKKILSLDEISSRLEDRKLIVVAKRLGLSYPTLKNLLDNDESNGNQATRRTVKLVSDYLQRF
jgi:hypothetical protein